MSHSLECAAAYESGEWHESRVLPGVRFQVARMSLSRRCALISQVKRLSSQAEYFAAGKSDSERLEASELEANMKLLYLCWGLMKVEGLTIDGVEADAEAVATLGPEELCEEIVEAVRKTCGLTEDERKN